MNLLNDRLFSKFACKFNLYRYIAAAAEKDGIFKVDTVASYSDGASNVREILRVRFK